MGRPCSSKATTVGVNSSPSALRRASGRPNSSKVDILLLYVPKSIPIDLSGMILLLKFCSRI